MIAWLQELDQFCFPVFGRFLPSVRSFPTKPQRAARSGYEAVGQLGSGHESDPAKRVVKHGTFPQQPLSD